MHTSRHSLILTAGLLLAPATFARPAPLDAQAVASRGPSATGVRTMAASAAVRYGSSVRLGNGEARSYVTVDAQGRPIEIGVAMAEQTLEGLPKVGTGHHGGHELPHTFLLDLPAQAGLPFRFVELNWNPSGHEPEGVYAGVPHFDFHFWIASKVEREAIVPTDAKYAEKANRLPSEEYIPAFNAALAPPGMEPAQVAVPMMGVHWTDMRSPELQGLLGKPEAYRPFTATFIHGSWDGRLVFWEPMITRAHILAKKTATDPAVRDEIIPIPTPARYQTPGYYPGAYRITWDAQAREYRIALTKFSQRG
jgi:hypothetical protein